MNIVLFDLPAQRLSLLPFTFSRPIADIRVGILRIAEKWEKVTGAPVSFLTAPYLQGKFAYRPTQDNCYICAQLCPDTDLWKAIQTLKDQQALVHGDQILALRTRENPENSQALLDLVPFGEKIAYHAPYTAIRRTWDIFLANRQEIIRDFALLTAGRQSMPLQDKHTVVYGAHNLFIEEGADIKAAIINAEEGPVYIGKNAHIQEGALIRGAFALCEGATVNMGAKMRGDTTIGPWCKVGGEISNSVLFAYSNKGHDGFIGNTVIGEWCNLGADTNTSNLKNDYSTVKVWDYALSDFVSSGQQFCGLMMGDYSKCSINTMFNTGTVVGLSANIFGAEFHEKFVPSFAWGNRREISKYRLDKAMESAERMMQRRGRSLTEEDRRIMRYVYENTHRYAV